MSGSSKTGSLKEGGRSIFSYPWGREGSKKKKTFVAISNSCYCSYQRFDIKTSHRG